MNKVLIALLIFGAAGLIVYFLAGNTSNLPENMQSDTSYEEVEQALKEEGNKRFVASCNAISDKSSCVDYIGSFWADENLAEHNCDGVGVYSEDKSCPYSEYGGCQTGGGTVTEMVIWAYKEGGGGYDDENIQYARGACNANPAATWVMPDDLLNSSNN